MIVECFARWYAVQKQFTVAADDRQKIVEVVRNSPGEPPQRFHFLNLTKLAFKLLALGLFFLKSAAHGIKSPGQPRDFILSRGLQSKGEVTSFECLDAAHQRDDRARDGVRN